jgi:hypothetical protein
MAMRKIVCSCGEQILLHGNENRVFCPACTLEVHIPDSGDGADDADVLELEAAGEELPAASGLQSREVLELDDSDDAAGQTLDSRPTVVEIKHRSNHSAVIVTLEAVHIGGIWRSKIEDIRAAIASGTPPDNVLDESARRIAFARIDYIECRPDEPDLRVFCKSKRSGAEGSETTIECGTIRLREEVEDALLDALGPKWTVKKMKMTLKAVMDRVGILAMTLLFFALLYFLCSMLELDPRHARGRAALALLPTRLVGGYWVCSMILLIPGAIFSWLTVMKLLNRPRVERIVRQRESPQTRPFISRN